MSMSPCPSSFLKCAGVTAGFQTCFTGMYATAGAVSAKTLAAAAVVQVSPLQAASLGAAGSVICIPISMLAGCVVTTAMEGGRGDSNQNSNQNSQGICALLCSAGCGALVTFTGNAMLGSSVPAKTAAMIGAVGAAETFVGVPIGVGCVVLGLMCVGGTTYLCCKSACGSEAAHVHVALPDDVNGRAAQYVLGAGDGVPSTLAAIAARNQGSVVTTDGDIVHNDGSKTRYTGGSNFRGPVSLTMGDRFVD